MLIIQQQREMATTNNLAFHPVNLWHMWRNWLCHQTCMWDAKRGQHKTPAANGFNICCIVTLQFFGKRPCNSFAQFQKKTERRKKKIGHQITPAEMQQCVGSVRCNDVDGNSAHACIVLEFWTDSFVTSLSKMAQWCVPSCAEAAVACKFEKQQKWICSCNAFF